VGKRFMPLAPPCPTAATFRPAGAAGRAPGGAESASPAPGDRHDAPRPCHRTVSADGTGRRIVAAVAGTASARWRRWAGPGAAAGGGRCGALRPLVLTVAGGAVYGAALGAWSGPRLALYAAIKLPAVLLLTAALTLPFQALVALVLGERLGLGRAARLNLAAFATAAALLASLAPVAALLSFTLPAPSPAERTTHNLLYLVQTAAVGGCGLAGTVALGRALARACSSRRAARRVFAAWVAVLALVGGEVAWALRPFVGSVYHEVALLRPDALDGNVYEFIWTDVAPHLLAGSGGRDERGGKRR